MLCDLKRLEFNFFINLKVGNSFFIKIHVYIYYTIVFRRKSQI